MGQDSFRVQKHRADPHKHLTCKVCLQKCPRKAKQNRRDEKSRGHYDSNSHRFCIYFDRNGKLQADSSPSIGESGRDEIFRYVAPKFRAVLDQLSSAKASPIEMEREAEEPSDAFRPPINKSTSTLPSAYPNVPKPSRKRRRSFSEDTELLLMNDNLTFIEDVGPDSANCQEEGLYIGVNDRKKLNEYLHDAFTSFQQINCRTLCKSLIRTIEPKKQVNFPYNGNLKPKGNKSHFDDSSVPKEADPQETKPRWWPAREVCPHKEPDHIKKEQRLGLLSHMLLNTLGPHIKCSVGDLKRAFATDLIKIKPAAKADILQDVWKVVEAVERFREGVLDAGTQILVQSRKEEARMLRGGGRSRKISDDALGEDNEGDDSENESQEGDSLPAAALLPLPSFHPQIQFVPHVVEENLGLPSPDGSRVKQEPASHYRLPEFQSFRDQPEYRTLREASPKLKRQRVSLENGIDFSFGSGDNIGILTDASNHDGMFPPLVQSDLTHWSMPSMHCAVSPNQPGPNITADLDPMQSRNHPYLPSLNENAHANGFYQYSSHFGHFPMGLADGLGDEQRHQLQAGHHLSMHCHTPTEGMSSHAYENGEDLHLGPHMRPPAGV